MAQHVLSLSYGKDSLACLGAIEQLGWPLDRIVHAEIWATSTISADPPPMVEFKKKADETILRRWGIKVEHFATQHARGVFGGKVSYENCFYHEITRGKHAGTITGFPMTKGAWCKDLKLTAIKGLGIGKNDVQYIGIAADEPNRLARLDGVTKISPLAVIGWTEPMCRQWCEDNNLLSPIYTTAARGGCWFCHNQGVDQLRKLRHNYPDLWALLMKWDLDSPVPFKSDGHTVHDYDNRFCAEDSGIVPADRRFRWKMIEEDT